MQPDLTNADVPRTLTWRFPFHWAVAVFVVSVAWVMIGPLWSQSGLPNSADGLLHLHRSAAVARSFADGVFWPRWFPDVYQGLGAPVFHFYSPLFYWLTGLLYWIGVPLSVAAKVVISAAFFLSILAVYRWVSLHFSSIAGLAAAALYVSHAHFFREYYFQGDYPQLVALLLLPLPLYGLARLFRCGDWWGWVVAPLGVAAIVMLHNITAIFAALMCVAYMLFLGFAPLPIIGLPEQSRGKTFWRRWLQCVAAGLLAVGLSSFFWLPALRETAFVQVDNLNEGFFHFAQYFLTWRELLSGPIRFDSRAANPAFPAMLGWASWLAMIAATLMMVVRSLLPRRAGQAPHGKLHFVWLWWLFGVLVSGFAIFMTVPQSELLWEQSLLIRLLQFPSRWLGLAAIGVTFLAGLLVESSGRHWRTTVALLGSLVAIGSTFSYLSYQLPFVPVNQLVPADTMNYERSSGVWGTTSGNEFLPRWAGVPGTNDADSVMRRYPANTASWRWLSPHHAQFETQPASSAGQVSLPLHYFPNWQVRIADEPLAAQPDEQGILTVALPPISSEPTSVTADSITLDIEWQPSSTQRLAEWVSRISLLLWLGVVMLVYRRTQTSVIRSAGSGEELWRREMRPILAGAVSMALLATLIYTWSPDWLMVQSPPDRVLGLSQSPAVPFGPSTDPQVALLGWELLNPQHFQPGDTLHLRFYWQGLQANLPVFHSFAHLYTTADKQSWAIAQNQNPGRIPTSKWQPALYYVDDLALTLPIDMPPLTYSLVVGLNDESGNRLNVPNNEDGLLSLQEITLLPLSAGWGQAIDAQVTSAATYDDRLVLQGYDLLPDPGGPILRLYWQVNQPITKALRVDIELYNEKNESIGSYSMLPLKGVLSTEHWQPGSLILDQHKLTLPEPIAPGNYHFALVLKDAATNQILRPIMTPANQKQFHNDTLLIPLFVPGN